MPALVFEMKLSKLIKAYLRGKIKTSGYWKSGGPLSIKEVPLPKLISNDWVIVRTIYCGICGSDMKEITLSGNRDNPLQTLISFPQIMGHEPVGIIERVGSTVENFKQGDRIRHINNVARVGTVTKDLTKSGVPNIIFVEWDGFEGELKWTLKRKQEDAGREYLRL